MLITCLRHATAEPHALSTDDAERALIKKGKNQVQRVAEFCRKSALMPAALYSSPLRRARQTATLLQNHLPDCPPVRSVEWLGLDITPDVVIAELQKLQAAEINDVWLVGHEPGLSVLIGHLLDASSDCFDIKKASLTRVEIDIFKPASGKLLWSIPCALMG